MLKNEYKLDHYQPLNFAQNSYPYIFENLKLNGCDTSLPNNEPFTLVETKTKRPTTVNLAMK